MIIIYKLLYYYNVIKLIWHIQWDTWLFLYYAKGLGNPYNFEHIFALLVSKQKSIISTKKSMIRNLHKILHSGYPNLLPTNSDTWTPVVTEALVTIARTWKQARWWSADEWTKKMWFLYLNGILLSHRKRI